MLLYQFNYKGQTKLYESTYFAVLNLLFLVPCKDAAAVFVLTTFFLTNKISDQQRSLGVALGTHTRKPATQCVHAYHICTTATTYTHR